MEYTAFGSGGDGPATLSGTDAPIDSACTGTSGTTSLAATNASFAANKLILIHQSYGASGVGNWEINIIQSYVAGTITTVFNLVNSYVIGAQVIKLPEYSSVTVSGTLTGKAWNGSTGGILAFLCSGETTVSGTITVQGKGFRGAAAVRHADGKQGEGYNAASGTTSETANTVGGGGGWAGGNHGGFGGGGGGGGGHVTAASAGGSAGVNGRGGDAGTIGVDGTDGAKMHFGGGGGSGGEHYDQGNAGAGSTGGGIVFILTQILNVTGSINANGVVGGDSTFGISDGGGGGGGGGGYVYVQAVQVIAGTNLITALGAVGGAHTGTGGDGGTGANGVVRLECCSYTGSTNPASSAAQGGYDYCFIPASIY